MQDVDGDGQEDRPEREEPVHGAVEYLGGQLRLGQTLNGVHDDDQDRDDQRQRRDAIGSVPEQDERQSSCGVFRGQASPMILRSM